MALAWLLFVPDQVVDALAVLADSERANLWQWTAFVLAAWLLSLNLAAWTAAALTEHGAVNSALPRALPPLASLGVAVGCLRAAAGLPEGQWAVLWTLGGLAFVGGLVAGLGPPASMSPAKPSSIWGYRLSLGCALGSATVYFVLCVWFGRDKAADAVAFGPLALALFAFAALLAIVSFLLVASERSRKPFVPLLLAWAAVATFTGCNDNSIVRSFPQRATGLAPGVDAIFAEWLDHRTQLTEPDAPYPVFVVASEGGGIRSAYLTAMTLARIQDRYPAFAQHVFAISGVSGGSVGATLFAGLCKNYAKNENAPPTGLPWSQPGPLEQKVNAIFKKDWLSPVLASSLYDDFVQGWLPARPDNDRARALEASLERSFQTVVGANTLAEPFMNLTHGFARSAVPALFLNTTTEDNGERLVISPLTLLGPKAEPIFYSLADRDWSLSIPLSTAAVLSARFPGITSSGLLPLGSKGVRVLDGGYYENSGCATAMNLVQMLELDYSHLPKRPYEVVVIRIGLGSNGSNWTGSGGPEPLSPLLGLYRARDGRGADAIRQLRTYMQALVEKNFRSWNDADGRMIEFVYDAKTAKLPLGWLLSTPAMERAKDQLRTPLDKAFPRPGDPEVALGQVVQRIQPIAKPALPKGLTNASRRAKPPSTPEGANPPKDTPSLGTGAG